MFERLFKGTGSLTKLIFRQQRFKILVWLAGLVTVTLACASSYPNVYQDVPSKMAFAMTMDNPAMVAMLGPGYETEDYLASFGTLFAHECLLFTTIVAGIMSILQVVNVTRNDEENERIELIRALPVGRLAYLSGGMVVMFTTNVLLALLTGISLALLGIDGIDTEGAFLYGAILGATGLIFGIITALLAQLAETSRKTAILSFSVLIAAYLIRGIGDVSNETFSFFSPLGWAARAQVFVDNYWWPILLAAALSMIIAFATFYLNSIRDMGAGFLPERKGKKQASPILQTIFGLVFRLQRTSILAWTIGIFALSASFGAVLGDLETYFADIEFMQAFISNEAGESITDQFVTLLIAIMSLIALIPSVSVVLKLKGEENKNLTENIYSRAVSRTRLLANYYLLAVIVNFIMQLMIVLGLWSVGQLVMEEAIAFGSTFTSAFAYLPAMWAVIGLAGLFVGTLPRASGLVWLYVIYCFIVIYLSEVLDFPQWMNNLSVFEHVPEYPIEELNFAAMAVLTFIATVMAICGMIAYNHRDITG
ncbi:ABC transporter permease [Thermoactinomyces mirandus]|uniref:ABC transporter permease n=1 Tax=Thermoactinomyces mirandus TaxID=2756294 RepID=A0A7W1XT25_9BACL|nr:ABC transporter permease [Thermoactinomyces mirandus]MBA4602685.1 ABC transporter permease [Thermoactinomyces mirandus]